MDATFGENQDDDDDQDGYMANVITPDPVIRINQWLKKPMSNIRRNIIVMCFDYEGVDRSTSPLGIDTQNSETQRTIIVDLESDDDSLETVDDHTHQGLFIFPYSDYILTLIKTTTLLLSLCQDIWRPCL